MLYTRVMWKDKEDSATTPINAYNLNIMDKGIEDLAKQFVPATPTKIGPVKPDNKTIRVLADGTLVAVGGGGGGGASSEAIDIDYVDTTGLGADNVQNAIEKVDERIDTETSDITAKLDKVFDGGFASVNKLNLDESAIFTEQTNTRERISNSEIKFTSTGNYARVGFFIDNLVVGQTYTVRFLYKKSGSNSSRVDLSNTISNWTPTYEAYYLNNTDSYEEIKYTFVANSNIFTFGVYITAGTGSGDIVYIKDAQLEVGESNSEYQPYAKSNVEITKELAQLEYDKNPFKSFIVFSTQPWWSTYMAGFNYPKANSYNWSIQSVALYKGNGETVMATTDFSVSTEGDAVRVGTRKTDVAGSMVAIAFKLTNK